MPPKLPAFSDVQQVMDRAAMNEKGVRYRLPSWGRAVNFRQRCYRFRKAQLKLLREDLGFVRDGVVSTPYDDLEITLQDETGMPLVKKPTAPSRFFDVVILHRELTGELIDEGAPLSFPEEPSDGLELE